MSVQSFDAPRGFVPKAEYFRVLRENDELRDRLRFHEVDKHKQVLLAHEVGDTPSTMHGRGRARTPPAPNSLLGLVRASLLEAPAYSTSRAIAERLKRKPGDVSRALAELMARGYAERIDGASGRGNRARYRALFPKE